MADRSHCRTAKFDPTTAHLAFHGGQLVTFVLSLVDRWWMPRRPADLTGHEPIMTYDLAVLAAIDLQMLAPRNSIPVGVHGDPRVAQIHPDPTVPEVKIT